MARIDRLSLRSAVATGTAALAALVFAGGPAAADVVADTPRLAVTADTEVVVDVAAQEIETTHVYSFVNRSTDQSITSFFETLPANAVDVTIDVDGREVLGVAVSTSGDFTEWFVPLPTALDPGEQATATIRWRRTELRGAPADGQFVSRALVALLPYGVGDSGPSTLTVVIPAGFTVVESGELVLEEQDDDDVDTGDEPMQRFSASVTAYEPTTFVAENDASLVRSQFEDPTQAGLDVTLASLQAVDGWLQAELHELLAEMAAWMPAAPPAPIELRQGWTGAGISRIADDGAVILAPDVEPWIAAKVVAEAWLGNVGISEPDFVSALATTLARQAATNVGAPPERTVPGQWTATTDVLMPAVGADGWQAVMAALQGQLNPYTGAGELPHPGPLDWRSLLDYFDLVGGAASAGDAMRLGLSDDQGFEIDRRAVALVDYRALADRAAPWSMPPLLREAMAAWDFDSFNDVQASVSDLVLARDEMAAAAAEFELDPNDYVRQQFESSTRSMDAAWTLHVEQRETLDVVGEARFMATNDRGLLARIGMIGGDIDAKREAMLASWDAGNFAEATDRGEALIHEIEASVGRGTLRLLGPIAAVVLMISGLGAWRRRRAAAAAAESSDHVNDDA